MDLPGKIDMYQRLSGTTLAQLEGWMGMKPPFRLDYEPKHMPKVLAKLAKVTGIPIEIWADDGRDLPDPLPIPKRPSGPGRPVKVESTTARLEQIGRRDRITQLIQQRFEGNQKDFARAVEMNESALSHYLGGRRTVTDPVLLKIAKFLGISSKWLLKGEGAMVGSPDLPEPDYTDEGAMLGRYLAERNISNRALGILMGLPESTASKQVGQYVAARQMRPDTKQRILEALQVSEDDIFSRPVSAPGWAYPQPLNDDDFVTLPFIDIPARASFDHNRFWDQPIGEKTVQVLKTQLQPNYQKKRPVVIEVNGDSMEPRLQSGHRLTAYEIDPGDWPYTTGVVAVRFREEFVIKRIKENRIRETGYLTLTSDNPAGGTISVPTSDIRVMWKLDEYVGGKVR